VTRAVTPKLGAYVGLAALGLLAALAVRLPELVVLAAPFAVVAAIGLAAVRTPQIAAELTLERERALEGDEVAAELVLEAAVGSPRVEFLLEVPRGLTVAGSNPRLVRLADGERRAFPVRFTCGRWGAYKLGRIYVRTHDALGLFCHETVLDERVPLKVYPTEEGLRSLLKPLDTQVFSGNHPARTKGEGIEFADLRPYVAGDRARQVNWRASARRAELWVNEYHPERNADVVVFLDSFTEARRGTRSTLDPALRAAASLVARYLRQKDRVGFVSFGGLLNWLLPATGARQLYRIVDAMLDTQIVLSYAWKDVDVIPRRTLPPKALVIALTPLLDDRSANVLLDLRGRGFDLVVVEISPLELLEQPRGDVEKLAYRLWHLRRDAMRGRFERAGVPLAIWEDESSLAAALEEVTTYRRYAGSVRAF
jgi:uncharacterized protein (DUF58 family)